MLTERKNCFLLIVVLLNVLTIWGQQGPYVLRGSLYLKGGDKYPYQLTLSVTGATVTGYSVTKWPNGVEPRIKIKGEIDRRFHTLTYAEKEVITALPTAGGQCFIEAKMSYQLRGGRYFIFGTFKGKDNRGRICNEGAVEFEEPYVPGSLFYHDSLAPAFKSSVAPAASTAKAKQKKENKPVADTLIREEVVNGYYKITEGVPRRISWNTDYCSIKVWDGGVIDGDIISIQLNGKEILTNYTLTKTRKQMLLPLREKVNTLTIVAGDEGTASPNTAQMILNDGPLEHKIMTFNKEGKTASIIITKNSPE